MLLVDSHAASILAGYDRIREAEALLPARWRQRLLRAYAQRRRAYERERLTLRSQSSLLHDPLFAGALIAAFLALLGWSGLFLGEGVGLGLTERRLAEWIGAGGAAATLASLIGWLTRRYLARPRPPAHPPAVRVESLLPRWQEGLRGDLPRLAPDKGAEGEYAFVRALQRLRSSGYILSRIQQERGDDLDVVLIWPAGIYVFEVKNWMGTVVWRGGAWRHVGANGRPAEVGEPPERQWQRMADDAAETLRRQAPDLLRRLPQLGQIRGGLVFTHERAQYEIAREAPFHWGTPAAWADHLERAKPLAGVAERDLMWAMDALLWRHHQVCGDGHSRSMDLCAQHMIAEVEASLATSMRRYESVK